MGAACIWGYLGRWCTVTRVERVAYGAIAAVLVIMSFGIMHTLRAETGAMHRTIIESPDGCTERTWRAGAEDRAIERPIACNMPAPRGE